MNTCGEMGGATEVLTRPQKIPTALSSLSP